MGSLPTRGAWIEITMACTNTPTERRRSPHGERGLKSTYSDMGEDVDKSLPTRGAWIEIERDRRAVFT